MNKNLKEQRWGVVNKAFERVFGVVWGVLVGRRGLEIVLDTTTRYRFGRLLWVICV